MIKHRTNGSFKIPFAELIHLSLYLGWIIDFKFEYTSSMIETNFTKARKGDWIKFVLDRREDYEYAIGYVDRFRKAGCQAKMAMGFTGSINPASIVANLIKDERWDIFLNVQLHKCINIK